MESLYLEVNEKIFYPLQNSSIHTSKVSNICQWPFQRTTSTYKDPSGITFQTTSSFHSPPSCATLKHFHSRGKIICTTSTTFNPSGLPSKYHTASMALLLTPTGTLLVQIIESLLAWILWISKHEKNYQFDP